MNGEYFNFRSLIVAVMEVEEDRRQKGGGAEERGDIRKLAISLINLAIVFGGRRMHSVGFTGSLLLPPRIGVTTGI